MAKSASTAKDEKKFSTITVRVGKIPGKIQDGIHLNGGRTVNHAVAGAEIEINDDDEIRVNGNEADDDTELKEGDTVLIVKAVSGNIA